MPLQRDLERRTFKRHQLEVNAWREGESHSLVELKTSNISAGGILLTSDHSLPKDSIVKLFVELPFFLDFVTAYCTIKHVKEQDDGYLIGVSMDEFDGISREKIMKFLDIYTDEMSDN